MLGAPMKTGPKSSLRARLVQEFFVWAIPKSSKLYCFVQDLMVKEHQQIFRQSFVQQNASSPIGPKRFPQIWDANCDSRYSRHVPTRQW